MTTFQNVVLHNVHMRDLTSFIKENIPYFHTIRTDEPVSKSFIQLLCNESEQVRVNICTEVIENIPFAEIERYLKKEISTYLSILNIHTDNTPARRFYLDRITLLISACDLDYFVDSMVKLMDVRPEYRDFMIDLFLLIWGRCDD